MKNKSYTVTIEIDNSPLDVFNHVNNVSKWWVKNEGEAASGQQTKFEGKSANLNDEFIIRSGDRHYSKQKLIEVVPGKKVVWLVTDSKINWLKKDKEEWTNTKMIFDITANGNKTLLKFTHQGLIPEIEYFEACSLGWDFFLRKDYSTSSPKKKRNKLIVK